MGVRLERGGLLLALGDVFGDLMLGHDIYSELLFLARSTKKMETEVKNLIED